jgi:peptidoglycan/LPS O-acetylase OafA/YrhL
MSDAINRNSNNFDFLRLVGALLVIFFTSYSLLDAYTLDPLVRLTDGVLDTGKLGVAIFFIISGYLITKSWDKRRNIGRFIWARFLRLVPALVGVALTTVFIIGPLTTHQNLLDYFTSLATWSYFSIITVFFPSYSLPSVFIHNPTSIVNGALWTLPVESTMYILVLALGATGILYKKRLTIVIILGMAGALLCTIIPVVHSAIPIIIHDAITTIDYLISPANMAFFLIGSLYYLFQDRIKYDSRVIMVAFIIWVLTFWSAELLAISYFICIPYIVLGLAFTRIPYINGIGKKADISYGLYIFHYPVQQTLINFFSLDSLTLLILSLLITVPLAWLSWHLIESKALRLKDIGLKQLSLRQAVWSR